ncbi:heme ABC transporter ATP-binding protein [Nocardioides caldifontis]|uniref:heme ABC transporter ATP-binding protein n=1 Tax=Nocardioides caldifontis TaxID=2588938 RepID=UPI0011DFD7D9|nr:heme ABC transporter ATP-binding protein [Nocardioides caldifontis]
MSAGTSTVLEARRVRVDRGGNPVVRDVDLDVRAGEVLALVGPNGAGKSTLLSVLAGDITPTAGTVHLDGRPLGRTPVAALARRRAVLLQEHHLSFPFRAREVVAMGRHPWRGHDEEQLDDHVVDEAMRTARVLPLADRAFPTLSGGEKARTSFARTLAQQASLLLLDEPTAALDLQHQEVVLGHSADLAAAAHAVVVVLHDLSLAAAYAHRICLLHRGSVAALGTPEQVLDAALLAEVYEHPVEVLRHPTTGALLVLPERGGPARPRTLTAVPSEEARP